jgi:dienelactone hydrolase
LERQILLMATLLKLGVLCTLLFSCNAVAQRTDFRNAEIAGFKTHFVFPHFKSKKEWEAHRVRVRDQVLAASGLLPFPAKSPLRPQFIRRIDYPEFSIQAVVIEPLPGYFLGGNLYLPAQSTSPAPAVLIPHGHWKRGRLEDQPSYSVPALAMNLARQGYVAFAYDMVGYNDTRQTPHSFETPERALWSFQPMGLQLWNSIRALDFVSSLPQVDADRIAVTGASGGGSQTIFLTAVDDRVKVSAPVNMVSAYMQGGDPCEEAPNLRVNTSNVEIAALAAPRPMILISCTQDWTRHTPEEEFPAIREIYSLYGRDRNVRNVHINAEHNYNKDSRAAVYGFLAEHLKMGLRPEQFVEKDYLKPGDDQMLAFPEGDLPKGTESMEQVFQSWKVLVRIQTDNDMQPADLKSALRVVLGVEPDPQVESGVEKNRIVMTRAGRGDRVSGIWNPGKGAPVLIVDPNGAEAASRTDLARQVVQSGRPLLLIDPFQPARVRADQSRFDRYFYSYNRSDDAERVQDILTALAFLRSKSKGPAELIGTGRAGVWSLFAAAVAPAAVNLIADLNGFSGTDDDFLARFNVPGIQRAGGLNTAMRLVNNLRAAIPAPALASYDSSN